MAWRRVTLVLALSTLAVLAGCTASVQPDTDRPIEVERSPVADGAVDTGTVTRTTADGEPGTPATDPYGGRTLVVAIEAPENGSRDYAPLVRRALDYWEANASRYAGYDVSYRLEPDATDPDFVVSVVDRIEGCGSEGDHTAGCAPYITRTEQFTPPERVRVVAGLSEESTVRVLVHEFGHTLGLGHDDEPQSVMRAKGRLATLPRTDAVNRSFAWESRTLSVHVAVGDDASDRAVLDRQVRETLAYFERGAEGTVPGDVSFVRASNRSAADVVVQVGGANPCDREAGSCRRLRGPDPDVDGRLETYNRFEVYVFGLDPGAVGWHVGRHLGYALGLTDDVEYPDPLRSTAGYEERRSEWWE